MQADAHFLRLCRYVEANAVRAMVAPGAEHWRWCSLWARRNRGSTLFKTLRPWPVDRPRRWTAEVNAVMDEDALDAVRLSVARGLPLGDPAWQKRIAGRPGLELTLRPRGRPRKQADNPS